MAKPLTDMQKVALECLQVSKVCSADDFYRHAFEALVRKGIVIKHNIGRQTTYTLAEDAK